MKRISSLFLALLLSAVLLISAMPAGAAVYTPDVDLYSEAYMLINLDDGSYPVVAQKNQDEKMYPASLTKIVTAMVTLNNVPDLSATTSVSQSAYDVLLGTGAQVANLKVGETLTIEQLLYLTMVHSACDATEVLAEYVGGSREGFVQMMNDYAASLGCEGTNFVNPDGLHDDNHYTTASDMAKIALDAVQNSTFMKISTTVQYEYNGTNFYHTNLMLRSGYVSYYYKYAKGIKTGSTDAAGYCVITTASKDGYNYLAVVMGAPVIDYNNDGYKEKCSFIDAATLFNWAFNSLKYSTLVQQNEILDEVAVKDGKDADSVRLVAKTDIAAIVPASLDKSTVIIKSQNKPEYVSAPIQQGDDVCTADIIYGDEVVATVELVAAQSVELSTFLKVINAVKAFFGLTLVKIIFLLILLFIIVYVSMVVSNYKKKEARRRKRAEAAEKQEEQKSNYDDNNPLPPPARR